MLNKKQLIFLKRLSIIYILIRLIADLSLLHPGARELAISWGWPINDFWAYTVAPVIIAMLLLAIEGAFRDIFDGRVVFFMMVVSISWALTLLLIGNTISMYLDALSWLLFALAVVNFAETEEKD